MRLGSSSVVSATRRRSYDTVPPAGTKRRRWPALRIFVLCLLTSVASLALSATPAFAERAYETHIAGFNSPHGVAVDGANNVWVSDPGQSGLISEYGPFPSQTKIGEQTGGGHWGGYYIWSLALNNSTHYLYVADSGPVAVDIFDNSGTFVEQLSHGFGGGYDYVAVDNSSSPSSGRLYVASTCCKVQAFAGSPAATANFTGTASYITENTITGTPGGSFGRVWNVATDESGNIYVVDQGKSVVDEFGPSGIFTREFSGAGVPGGFSSNLTGVAVDPTNGDVLVADTGNDVVDELTSSGEYVEQLTGPTGESFGSLAGGIAVSSEGYAYVVDGSKQVVDIFGPNALLPKVTYEPMTNETQTSGKVHASIDLNGGPEVTSCSVQYGTTTAYGSSASCSPPPPYTGTTKISAELSGLTTETEYHYRVVVTTANGTKKGPDQTFTPHAVLGLSTEPATSVERNTATLNGAFEGNGEDTHWYFEWGETGSYGHKTTVEDAGTATGAQSEHADLSGLTVETVYHYRFVAYDAKGTTYGADRSFKTLAAVENLSTEPAANVTATTATLKAYYLGIGEDVHYYFEWGTDTTYGHVSAAPPGTDNGSPSGAQELSFDLGRLKPYTTYHYRVIASDAAGISYGSDKGFTTLGRYEFLSDFGSAGSGAGQLEQPQDVAVNSENGDVYVADTGNHRVDEFSSSGTFVRAFGADVGGPGVNVCTSSCQAGTPGSAPGQLTTPRFVEVDNSGSPSAGDVYVADTGSNTVQKFDSAGNLIAGWGKGGVVEFATGGVGGTIGGITVDVAGNLYVLTDNEPYYWTEIGQDGLATHRWPTSDFNEEASQELGTPGGMGIDINGQGVWYELQIPYGYYGGVKYAMHGGPTYTIGQLYIGGYGAEELSNTGLAIDRSSGDVYVDQANRIDQFEATSACPSSGCSPQDSFGKGQLHSATGLAVRPSNGLLYAANTADNDIAVFSPLPLPDVTTGPATNVGATSATITGHVDPAGGQVSNCYFESVSLPLGNEVQTITLSGATGGTFTLTLKGLETGPVYWNQGGEGAAQSIEYALANLPIVGSENVKVTGPETGPWAVEFRNRLGDTDLPQLTANTSGLVPPSATLTVSTKQDGHGLAEASVAPCSPSTPFSAPTDVSADLTGLTPFTSYQYRLVAIRADGKGFPRLGQWRTVTPGPTLAPAVDSTSFSDVGPTSATLSAQINPNLAPTIYRFQYGTNTSDEFQTLPSESIGEDGVDHSVSSKITELTPGSTYRFRVVAINLNGPTAGPEETFTTPDRPTVGGSAASGITETAATLSAQIKPGFRPTTYHFDYGLTTIYGARTPESASIGSDDSVHSVSGGLSGLTPRTTYHYRVVASNEIGTTVGPDQTFTTASPPEEAGPPPPPPTKCRPGFVRKHGKCVRKHRHKHRHKRRGH